MLTPPSTAELQDAIRIFRAVCEDGPPPGNYTELVAAVTRLLDLAARMKDEELGKSESEPRIDHLAAYRLGIKRFADLEFNNDDDLQAGQDTSIFPTDDLGDIYADMCQVDALFNAGMDQNARWQFRFGFEYHWAEHACGLLAYMLRTKRL